jgi:hypothetical protein
MDRRSHNLVFLTMVTMVTAIVLVGGYLFVAGAGPGRDDRGEIPGASVEGLAAAGDETLLGRSGSDERPVLEVADDPADEGTAPKTVAGVPVAPSTTAAADAAVDPGAPSAGTEPPGDDGSGPEPASPSTSSPDGATTIPLTAGEIALVEAGLTPVELELARLTNELRADPDGPLRREGPVTDCDGRIAIDPDTGGYRPAPTLAVSAEASLRVARPWSVELAADFRHRPEAGIGALQEAGVAVLAAGENIAYHNFDDTAMRHFVGWRESDGHFCNMMDPAFTHLAIGEHAGADGFSYATQNLFSLQGAPKPAVDPGRSDG